MSRRAPFAAPGVALCMVMLPLLLVTGCSARSAGALPPGATPAATTSAAAATVPRETPEASTPPPTTGVTVATDRDVYAPTDPVHATATNRRATSLAAAGGQANCGIFEVQVKTAQGWQTASIAPCPAGKAGGPVQIAPGATHSESITATANGGALPAGTYRLVVSFTIVTVPPPSAQPPRGEGTPLPPGRGITVASPLTTVYSAPFVVR